MLKPVIRFQPVKNILANVFPSNLIPHRNAQIKYPYLKVKPPPAYTVRPPDLDIAFSGSTYDTKVKRRRKIKDPNVPVFGLNPVECLKWTDWRMVRDVRRRTIYCNHFPLKNNLTCLFRNDLLPHTVRVSCSCFTPNRHNFSHAVSITLEFHSSFLGICPFRGLSPIQRSEIIRMPLAVYTNISWTRKIFEIQNV